MVLLPRNVATEPTPTAAELPWTCRVGHAGSVNPRAVVAAEAIVVTADIATDVEALEADVRTDQPVPPVPGFGVDAACRWSTGYRHGRPPDFRTSVEAARIKGHVDRVERGQIVHGHLNSVFPLPSITLGADAEAGRRTAGSAADVAVGSRREFRRVGETKLETREARGEVADLVRIAIVTVILDGRRKGRVGGPASMEVEVLRVEAEARQGRRGAVDHLGHDAVGGARLDTTPIAREEQVVFVDLVAELIGFQLDAETDGGAVIELGDAVEPDFRLLANTHRATIPRDGPQGSAPHPRNRRCDRAATDTIPVTDDEEPLVIAVDADLDRLGCLGGRRHQAR